jgi:hypothetical protein
MFPKMLLGVILGGAAGFGFSALIRRVGPT